jgi:hypothetical protein
MECIGQDAGAKPENRWLVRIAQVPGLRDYPQA